MSESTFGDNVMAKMASEQMSRARELEEELRKRDIEIGEMKKEITKLRAEHTQREALEAHIVRVLAETKNGLGQLLELFLVSTK